MGAVIGAKSIDSLLTHRELDTILKSTLLSPLLNLSNIMNDNVTRTYPLLSQLIMGQIHSRPVTQDPSENINQFVDIFQDYFNVVSELFRSNRARMSNILTPEIIETASQTDFMKDESTIREEITSENQVLGKHRILLESIPDIELD
ncbi:hypothetical protein I4U23_005625 [Adineta vaga]|nr:hypothetical protein I4U23_005625 [Adineta vaga]